MTQAVNFQNLTHIQNHQQSLLEEVEKEGMRGLLSTLREGFKSQLEPTVFQDDNDIKNENKNEIEQHESKNKKCINEYFLRKMQSRRGRKNKLCYRCFFVFNTEFKAKSLDRKLETSLERDYVKMVWGTCVSHKFNKFIYLKDNFIDLSQPHIT